MCKKHKKVIQSNFFLLQWMMNTSWVLENSLSNCKAQGKHMFVMDSNTSSIVLIVSYWVILAHPKGLTLRYYWYQLGTLYTHEINLHVPTWDWVLHVKWVNPSFLCLKLDDLPNQSRQPGFETKLLLWRIDGGNSDEIQ